MAAISSCYWWHWHFLALPLASHRGLRNNWKLLPLLLMAMAMDTWLMAPDPTQTLTLPIIMARRRGPLRGVNKKLEFWGDTGAKRNHYKFKMKDQYFLII